jgi:hypothetical protein
MKIKLWVSWPRKQNPNTTENLSAKSESSALWRNIFAYGKEKSKMVFFPSSSSASHKVHRAQQINVIEQFVVVSAINFVKRQRKEKRINYKHPGLVFLGLRASNFFSVLFYFPLLWFFDRQSQVLTYLLTSL